VAVLPGEHSDGVGQAVQHEHAAQPPTAHPGQHGSPHRQPLGHHAVGVHRAAQLPIEARLLINIASALLLLFRLRIRKPLFRHFMSEFALSIKLIDTSLICEIYLQVIAFRIINCFRDNMKIKHTRLG
jgi:hypothetical protein